MSDERTSADQSMEDILASIRKIISEDDTGLPPPPPGWNAGEGEPVVESPKDMAAPMTSRPAGASGAAADDLSDILEPAAQASPRTGVGAAIAAKPGSPRALDAVAAARTVAGTTGAGGERAALPFGQETGRGTSASPAAGGQIDSGHRNSLRDRMASLTARHSGELSPGAATGGPERSKPEPLAFTLGGTAGRETPAGGSPEGERPVPGGSPATAGLRAATPAESGLEARRTGSQSGGAVAVDRLAGDPPGGSGMEAGEAVAAATPAGLRAGGAAVAGVRPTESISPTLAVARTVAPTAGVAPAGATAGPVASVPAGAPQKPQSSDVPPAPREGSSAVLGGARPGLVKAVEQSAQKTGPAAAQRPGVGAAGVARVPVTEPAKEVAAAVVTEKPAIPSSEAVGPAALNEVARQRGAATTEDGVGAGAAGDTAGAVADGVAREPRAAESPTLEEVVREALGPVLRTWLDQNLPRLVEEQVRAEVERAVAKAKPGADA